MTRPGPPLLPDPVPPEPWSQAPLPLVPATPKPRRKSSGTGLIVSGSILLGVAVVAVIVALIVAVPLLDFDPASNFTRVAAPGPSSITLEAGETDVWLEYFDSGSQPVDISTVTIELQRTREEVPIQSLNTTETITVGNRVSERVGRVVVPESGVYRVSTDDERADAIAFGRSSASTTVIAFLVLILTLIVGGTTGLAGLTLLIVGLVLRVAGRRGKRT